MSTARNIAADYHRAYSSLTRDLLAGLKGLRPASWRREVGLWIAVYALAAVLYRLPPL